MNTRQSLAFTIAALLAPVVCAAAMPAEESGETLLELHSHRWYEDFLANIRISDDGRWALQTAADGRQVLVGLPSGVSASERLRGGLETFEQAAFCGSGWLRLATRQDKHVWLWQPADRAPMQPITVPAAATPLCSADGRHLAHYIASSARLSAAAVGEIWIGDRAKQLRVPLDSVVIRAAFSHDGKLLYALGRQQDGTAALYSISTSTREVNKLIGQLDASIVPGNDLAVTPDDAAAILPLAGKDIPRDSDRQKPYADRWLKLYRFDLHGHELTLIQSHSGQDDSDPAVVGHDLYWVSTRVTNSVAIVPSTGGATRELIAGQAANLPSWSSDGKELAFVVGQYRLVDLPLDLDVAIAGIDDSAQLTTAPRMFIVGNNEDFPPSWSPDGRWIAWHSHRAAHDLPYAHAAGATDDIWLRSAKNPAAPEVRLTNGGRDAGWVYWAPDGHSVVYSISDRNAPSAAPQVRITNIDPSTGRALGEQRLKLPSSIQNPLIVEWSPQGDELAIEDAATPTEHVLWIVSRDGSRCRKLITFHSETIGGISWLRQEKALVFAALEGDRMQIFTVSTAGGPAVRVTDGTGNFMHPRVSPDGRWIAFTHIETVHTIQRQSMGLGGAL